MTPKPGFAQRASGVNAATASLRTTIASPSLLLKTNRISRFAGYNKPSANGTKGMWIPPSWLQCVNTRHHAMSAASSRVWTGARTWYIQCRSVRRGSGVSGNFSRSGRRSGTVLSESHPIAEAIGLLSTDRRRWGNPQVRLRPKYQ